MSETKILIQNISDGQQVANVVGGLYVNSLCTPGKEFYECMLTTNEQIQHNFTMLCLEWFGALASEKNYDERNEASWRYANVISYLLQYEHFDRYKIYAKGIKAEFEFDYRSDKSAVQLFEGYLSHSENNNAFIQQMLREHKTNQQTFSGMCCEWFKTAAKLPGKKSRYVSLAREAAKHYTRFPFI